MSDLIKKEIISLLKSWRVKAEDLTTPPNPEMGDFSFACFNIAKEIKKNPVEIAKEICSKIDNQKTKIVEKVEAVGPYVNFYLKTSEVVKTIITDLYRQGEKYGQNNFGKGKKVLLEYPSQNTHKEFHIGHLRNVCIGNSLVKLFEKNGYKAIPINYLNDFGAHVVKSLWFIIKVKSLKSKVKSQKLIKNKQKWLGELYAEANDYIKEHPECKAELDELQKKFEAKDKSVWPLFLKTRKWSEDGFNKIFKELGSVYKTVFYESEVKAGGQKIVDNLLKNGIAEVGEGGAIIVNLEKYGLDIGLLRKSNGSGLYLTSDLSLAEKKTKKYKVDESINITGSEQVFYFKQLFKILELYGFKHKMTHIGYGLVNLPSGKMSSRAGNVILYEDLRNEIKDFMLKETEKRHSNWNRKKIEKTVNILTQAILKFTMLKHEANKVITFDFKEAVSFEGFSAPYILYVVARINSIFRKSKVKSLKSKVNYFLFNEPEEKKLAIMIGQYGEIVKKALENYNPSVIARYCFDLAQIFNDFYNKYSILDDENSELTKARLFLCDSTRKVLENALKLLTIDVVDEM